MVEFQCAVAARDRDEPMFATASQVRRWLLIEVRGAWGRDAVADSDLARYAPGGWRRRLQAEQIRVIAIRRDLDRSSQDALQMFYVDSGDGPTAAAAGAAGRHAARAPSTPPPICRSSVTADRLASLIAIRSYWCARTAATMPCCATFGRPLARDLREGAAARRRVGVLAHRRRSLRRQPRDPARRPVLRSLRRRRPPNA